MERNATYNYSNESAGVTSMTNGVAINYGDVAPEAKENFSYETTNVKYNTLDNLKKYNMQLYNYATPCEYCQTILDGTAVPLPENPEDANIGFWSDSLSVSVPEANGIFSKSVTIYLDSDKQYSSQGFTFTFDKFNNIYPTSLTIQWSRVTDDEMTIIHTETFTPDSAFYFCRYKAKNFNSVAITFNSLNMPSNRLKVESIDFGYGTIFFGDELRNASVSQSINPISTDISINTCSFSLDSKSDMEYSFQKKQPISIYFNDKLRATVFVKQSTRKGKFLWDVSCEDYFGIMDDTIYKGGIYKDKKAGELLEDIFDTCEVPNSISDSVYNMTVTGYIPYTTCRAALMQVCFACQCVANTSESSVVNIGFLNDEVTQTIPLSRIMQGQNFSDSDTVTRVELTFHTYRKSNEQEDLYTAESSETRENILVKFSEPHYNLSINGGTITESGVNYAVITANEGCVLKGYKYEHDTQIKTKTNDVVLDSDLENVTSITDATLVSSANVDSVINKCYNWIVNTSSTSAKIVEGKNVEYGKKIKYGRSKYGRFKYGGYAPNKVTYDKVVNTGDKITLNTEYMGDYTGVVISQKYSLTGNIIVKEAVVK